ncbi:hypothetical protein Btru_061834 [Bulinus truncatus]|nr:hypothetical protein Btru_061834 [Bulinus truncatus]
MGQILSAITKPVRNINIENRALKLLEKRKKIADPSPKHPTTVKILSRVREENPELFQKEETRHELLHENLKKVYVESQDPPLQASSDKKHIPLSRGAFVDSELGVMDIQYPTPEGRATLKTVFSFLGKHHANPNEITANAIAQEHKLDADQVNHILKHFRIFHLYIPDEMLKDKSMKKAVKQQLDQAHPGFIHVPGKPKLGVTAESETPAVLTADIRGAQNGSGTKT